MQHSQFPNNQDHLAAHPEEADRVAAVQAKVNATRALMLENVDRTAARGEKLSALQERTEELAASAAAFSRQGRQLKRQLCWEGARVKAAIFCSVFLIVAVVVIILACFSGGGNRCVPRRAQ